MRQDKKERIIFAGILLATMVLIAILSAGCGSGSSGGGLPPGLTGEGVAITCMDAQTDQQAACRGLLEPISKATREVLEAELYRTALYNAGDSLAGTLLYIESEMTNFRFINAPIYYYTHYYFNNFPPNGQPGIQSGRIDLKPTEILSDKSGINICSPYPNVLDCPYLGPGELHTYIYNASHLNGAGAMGDPQTDEVVARGIVRFNLKTP